MRLLIWQRIQIREAIARANDYGVNVNEKTVCEHDCIIAIWVSRGGGGRCRSYVTYVELTQYGKVKCVEYLYFFLLKNELKKLQPIDIVTLSGH